jgi:hypothetical protein
LSVADALVNAARDGFHFGQFGHRMIVRAGVGGGKVVAGDGQPMQYMMSLAQVREVPGVTDGVKKAGSGKACERRQQSFWAPSGAMKAKARLSMY